MNLSIDRERLISEIESLGQISEAEPPVVTRIVFTEADLRARAWLIAKCKEAGLDVRQDAVGNTFARWKGSEVKAAAVATGSHIDAIPNAGKYDGVVGVLGGLEAIRALQRGGFQQKRSIELLIFTSEEPTRFGVGCLGSRLLSGALSAESASKLFDADGKSLDEVRQSAGFDGELNGVRLSVGHFHAFVELHIEQGPLLEREKIPLGIVERIAAPASARIVIEGAGGHAGGVLMPERRDALCAAAELVLEVERAARSTGAMDTVATVGICDIFPGAVNSIPSRARLSLDVRDTDLARRDGVMSEIAHASKMISEKRQVAIQSELLNADAPADCAPEVVQALADSCRKHKLAYLPMVSRAYHDSLFISRITPTAMLFIPCRNGYSHRPDEYASPDDIARGTLILAETLAELAG
ncbi:MAG TPA: M20 family metallo-hydrolase [Candidatus Dormibacteraeota bacterium]|jgi:ureidoglycolate amidohydrolase|nr:M20 family metallo-hydrolase [Candidatus Dormibacteraeota bacterium]